MADSGSATIKDEKSTDLVLNANPTIIYTAPDLLLLAENDTLIWQTITRQINTPSMATLELKVTDSDGNSVHPENVTIKESGVDMKLQTTRKEYVMIMENPADGEKTAMFIGEISGSDLDFSFGSDIINAVGIERRLWDISIDGKWAIYKTDPEWARGSECIFNKAGKETYSDSKLCFDDTLSGSTSSWDCKRMADYLANSHNGYFQDNFTIDEPDYPQNIDEWIEFDLWKYDVSLADKIQDEFSAVTPNDVDISGMKIFDAISEIIRHVGNYQLRYEYFESGGFWKLRAYIASVDTDNVRDIEWGDRGGVPNRSLDFEGGSISMNRYNKYRKAVSRGKKSLVQVAFVYPDMPADLTSAGANIGDVVKLTRDWESADETAFDSASNPSITDASKEARYNDVYAKFKVDLSDTHNNKYWVGGTPDEEFFSKYPFTVLQYVKIHPTLITKNNDNTFENVKVWFYDDAESEWITQNEMGVSMFIRGDDVGGFRISMNASKRKDLGAILDSGYMVITAVMEIGSMARGVYGYDADNNLTDDEDDISTADDEQIFYSDLQQFQNYISWFAPKNYNYTSGAFELYDGSFERDDDEAIQSHAKSFMIRAETPDNSGIIVVRGWKTSWRPGELLRNANGGNRTININSYIESIALANVDQGAGYTTQLGFSTGVLS